MIKNTKINPLNIFEVRRAKVAPPHFEYVNIPLKYNLEDSLNKWIEKHLNNKYYIGKNVILDDENKIIKVVTVGFEKTKDMSFFMLACPHLKYK